MDEEIQKLQKQIDDVNASLKKMAQEPPFQDHQHNGFDSTKVEHIDVNLKKIYVHHTIQGTAAATAANYGVFFIVPMTCILNVFKESHETAGSVSGTLTLEKLTGTQAPDGGAVMLAATVSLTSTANTVQSGTMTGTLANRTLHAGDRLCLKDGGTLTSIAGVSVLIELIIV